MTNEPNETPSTQFIQSGEALKAPLPPSEVTATPLTDEAKAELIADAMRKINPPPNPALTFVDAVRTALEAKGFKPKCPACPSIGWLSFEIFGAPCAVATYIQNTHIPIAIIVCRKCGHVSPHSLNAIGVTIQAEEKRIITPDQIQQKPLIVTG
jgi:hypothetical protein